MEEEEIGIFDVLKNKSTIPIRKRTKLGNTDIEIDTNFGDSSYDKSFYPDAVVNKDGTGLSLFESINENRSDRQSNIAKIGAGVGRATVKALSEVAKLPGVVGGVLASPFVEDGEGLDMAFNNKWIQAVEHLNESVNEEMLPVYVSKAVQDGDLWDKISSVDFWATEGADGVGFMAGMLAPGAIINKIGLGAKIFKGLESTGALLNKADEAANLLNKVGLTPSNIELGTQTIANTLVEAGAEAKGAGDAYMASIERELQEGAITEEEAKIKKATVMRNVFTANAAILMGPNAVMSKMLWGKARNKAVGNLFNDAGEVVEEATKRSLKGKAIDLGKDVVQASAREGFFEEGLQSTAETYFTENVDNDFMDFIGDLPASYAKTLSSTEGQTAIFLGAVLGGGMQSITGKLSRNKERAKTTELLGQLHKVDSFYKLFSEDIYDGETKKLDNVKFKSKLEALNNSEKISELFDKAVENGNDQDVKILRNYIAGEITKPFIVNGELGTDALKQYFESSKTISELANREESEIEDIVGPILKKAEKLKGDFELFQEFAPSFINIKNDNSTKKDQMQYYDALSSEYLGRKNARYFFEEELESLKSKKDKLIKSLDLEEESQLNNLPLQDLFKDITTYEKIVKKLKQEDNKFWDKAYHQKQFDSFVNQRVQLDKAQEKEDEVTEAVNSVDNATTPEEVDAVPKTNTIADSELKYKKNLKKKDLADKKEKETNQQIQEQEDNSESLKNKASAEETNLLNLVNKISKEANIGETYAPEELLATTDYAEELGVITDITDDYLEVTIANTENTVLQFNRSFDVKTPESNPEQEFKTEGSENHDALIPKTNENVEDVSTAKAQSGSKLISTTRDGKKFDFVSEAYLDYERTPIDKTGKEVTFEINLSKLDNRNWTNAQKGYQNLVNGETLDQKQIDFLIDNLPINAVISENIKTSIETLPTTPGGQEVFNLSSKILRRNIVNALVSGNKIEDISTTIEGQYGGILRVTPTVEENNIQDLHFLSNLSEKDKIKTIKDNIGIVKDTGDIELTDGTIIPFKKANAKGELYLMIPKANGEKFPLKLNIKRISDRDAKLLHKLYSLRLKEADINKSTALNEIEDKEFVKTIKAEFKEELNLIGKNYNDITIKDIIDFFIWDGTKSPKSQVRFKGTGKKGESVLVYGNPETTGMEVPMGEILDEGAFIDWITFHKRYGISFKTKKNQDSRASISINDKYLKYLLDNTILNTNAVVNEPTFTGYTNIYLDSNNVSIKSDSNELSSKEHAAMMKEIKEKVGDPYINKKMKEGISPLKSMVTMEVDMADEIQAIKNKYQKIRNSEEIFVSSQDIENTEDNKIVKEKKEKIQNKEEISPELVKELFTLLKSKGLIKIGKFSKTLLSGTNKENFNALKELADKNNVSIENILTKCD